MVIDSGGRRRFLRRGAVALVGGLAGCLGRGSDDAGSAAKLVPNYGPDGDHDLEQVAVSGETVIVSTTPEPESWPEEPGSAYVFERADDSWQQTAELTRPDDAPEDEFGDPVAIDGDTAVVGAWYEDEPEEWIAGAAYVFERTESGRWDRRARLVPGIDEPTGLPAGHAHAVAIDGDTVVLGSPTHADDGAGRPGTAFVYRRTDEGWQRRAELVPDGGDRDRGREYGTSVAVAGDTALIGAETATTEADAATGAVYAFERSNGDWRQQPPIVAEDGTASHGFGAAVALDGRSALVAADDGESVSVFERTESGGWSHQTTLRDDESGCVGDAIAIADDTALVGDACRSSATVSARSSGTWTRRETLTAPDGAGRTFGSTVAIDDDTAVVGDWRQNVDGGHGAAYVFTV